MPYEFLSAVLWSQVGRDLLSITCLKVFPYLCNCDCKYTVLYAEKELKYGLLALHINLHDISFHLELPATLDSHYF